MFTDNEIAQYSRHFSLPQVGKDGQLALKKARVLCVGAGGLGSPVLLYLAAAGVGTLGIVDDDLVDYSNLQRQVLFSQDDIGQAKAECARRRLKSLNPYIDVIPYVTRLTKSNALRLLSNYDIIVDGTDNFSTRYLINDVCFTLNKPNVYGSIFQFEGQCSVFHKDHSPCYRCLFPNVPKDFAPSCAEAGVLGILPGLLGSIQANEVIKLILNIGEPLLGRLLSVDTLSMDINKFNVSKNPDCILCNYKKDFTELQYDDQEFCSLEFKQVGISHDEFQQLKQDVSDLFLLDVRELPEHQAFNIGGICIPLDTLRERLDEVPQDKKIIAYCDVGEISKGAVSLLRKLGYSDVQSLSGGIIGLM